jgi:hypothetical protein
MTPDEARANIVAAAGNYAAMRIHDMAAKDIHETETQIKDREEWEARNGTPEQNAIQWLDRTVMEYLPIIIEGRGK